MIKLQTIISNNQSIQCLALGMAYRHYYIHNDLRSSYTLYVRPRFNPPFFYGDLAWKTAEPSLYLHALFPGYFAFPTHSFWPSCKQGEERQARGICWRPYFSQMKGNLQQHQISHFYFFLYHFTNNQM